MERYDSPGLRIAAFGLGIYLGAVLADAAMQAAEERRRREVAELLGLEIQPAEA